MLIQVTYGNENFQRSSAKYQILTCRSQNFMSAPEAQTHLWVAARDRLHDVKRQGHMRQIPAAPGKKEVFGKWTSTGYEVPEGLLLKLHGQRKLAEMVSGKVTNACMFLKIREGAPLIRVTGRLSGDARASQRAVTVFEGRADVLTLEDAVLEGFEVRPAFALAFEGYNVRTLFQVKQLAAGLQERTIIEKRIVENSQGEQVVVEEESTSRIIDL